MSHDVTRHGFREFSREDRRSKMSFSKGPTISFVPGLIVVYRWKNATYNMHPLVRDLYKRALVVGRDYPLGLSYVRQTWKTALRNPENCPSCYDPNGKLVPGLFPDNNGFGSNKQTEIADCEREIRKAVGKGRYMIREMIGVIQLKKYRTMKRRYSDKPPSKEMKDTNFRESKSPEK